MPKLFHELPPDKRRCVLYTWHDVLNRYSGGPSEPFAEFAVTWRLSNYLLGYPPTPVAELRAWYAKEQARWAEYE